VSYIYINVKPKHAYSHVALCKKVDLIEQNQCDFWIQHIEIVLDQLKKPRHQICCRPVISTCGSSTLMYCYCRQWGL